MDGATVTGQSCPPYVPRQHLAIGFITQRGNATYKTSTLRSWANYTSRLLSHEEGRSLAQSGHAGAVCTAAHESWQGSYNPAHAV